jgi:hypothetical protein
MLRQKALGRKAFFLTLTMRHGKTDRLKKTSSRLVDAWRMSTQGRGNWKKSCGVTGYLRAIEVTWTESNGWHPHFHVIIWTDGSVSQREIERQITDRWLHCVAACGGSAIEKRGVDLREIGCGQEASVGDYLGKMGLYFTGLDKVSSSGGYSQWGLAAAAAECSSKGDAPVRMWREFVSATKGMRQLCCSKGVMPKEDLEGNAGEEEEEAVAFVGTVSAAIWRWGAWNVPFWTSIVTEKAELGVVGFSAWKKEIRHRYKEYRWRKGSSRDG